jgi:hypothetical protein
VSDGNPAKSSSKGEQFTAENALSLFRLYEDKGWAVKQQMLASVGWLTPFVFGLLAYPFTKSPDPSNIEVAGLTAFFLSLFMALLTVISLMHANRDYQRSHDVIKYARGKTLLPDDIFKIILGEKDNLDLLKEDEWQWLRKLKQLWLRLFSYIGRQLTWLCWLKLLWLRHFSYIGWQFLVILGFTVFLALFSLDRLTCNILQKLASFS